MIDKLRSQLDALLRDLRPAGGRSPRLAVTELERRDVPAPLNVKDLLTIYLDQTTNPAGEVGSIDNGVGVYNTFIDQEVQNFGNVNGTGQPRFGAGGVATLDGDVYNFNTRPGSTDPYGNSTDDASTLYRIDPETGGVSVLASFGRESGGLARASNGTLLNVWFDGKYTTNAAGNPDSATVGISRIDPFTGAETVLFSRPATGLPVAATDPPALKPNGLVELGGAVYYTDSCAGRTGNSFGVGQADDLSVIRRVDLGTVVEAAVVTFARESRGLTATIEDDPRLVYASFDGQYGTNLYRTPDSAQNLLSLLDPASGTEEVLENYPVPNLPYNGSPYGFNSVPPIQKIDGVAVGIGLPGVLPGDNEVYFTLSTPVRRDSGPSGGVDDNSQLYLRSAFASAFFQKAFNRQSLGLSIVPENSAPVSNPDFYSTAANKTLTVPAKGVLANDFDPDANAITATISTPPPAAEGTVTLNADGSFTFTPAANFVGISTFKYVATDSKGDSGSPTAVQVSVSNIKPQASSDSFSVVAGKTLTVPAPGLLVNDSDPDMTGPISVNGVTTPPPMAQGTVAVQPDGSFVFTPATGFVGVASFEYTITDGIATSSPASVQIDVTNSNPNTSEDNYSTPSNKALMIEAPGVLGNDSDPDMNGTLSAVLLAPPAAAEGTVTLNSDGSFAFTPAFNFFGTASFIYRADDGLGGQSQPTTVFVSVTNQHPVATDDNYSTPVGQTLTVAAPGLLANDSDPDMNGTLSVFSFTPLAPGQGSLIVNPDGSFTYTPPGSFSGVVTFQYQPTDGISPSDQPATVSISVTGTGLFAQNDTYLTPAGKTLTVPAPGVLANDSNSGGSGTLAASLLTPPPATEGTLLSFNTDGSFVFVPDPTFAGVTQFTYLLTDGFTSAPPATVSLFVANTAPVGQPDAYTTPAGKSLVVPAPGVLANDTDAEGNGPFVAELVTGLPTGKGLLNFNPDGSFQYFATFVGVTSFTYRLRDAAGAFSQPVTVTLTSTNQPPVAVDDTFNTPAGKAVSGAVTTNDFDPDGTGPFPAQLVADVPATAGTLSLSAYSGFTFTPAPGFVGPAQFTYRIFDNNAGAPSNVATVTINVTNQAPTAIPDSFSTPAGQPLTVAAPGLLANDTDTDGNPLTAALSVPPAATQGKATVNPDGTFTFTPAAGFAGVATFQYVANDGFVNSAPATVSVAVGNAPPVAADDTFTTPAGRPLTVAAPGVLANDTDANGDPLSAELDTDPVGGPGQLVLNPDGSFTYTPPAGFAGTATFIYFVTDGSDFADATITITVTNAPPVAVSDTFSTRAGRPLTVPAATGLLANDFDPDRTGPLVARLFAAPDPAQGTVTVNPNGSFTFTPAGTFSGTATFQYVANDGIADSPPATVRVLVTNSPPTGPGADIYSVPKNKTLTVPASLGVLANDTDPDGDPLFAVLDAGVSADGGRLSFGKDGSFVFVPAAGFVGQTTFTYRASDGFSTGPVQTVTLTVTNAPPVPQPDSFTTPAGQVLTIPAPGVLANDADADGDTITAVLEPDSAVGGTVTLNPTGSFAFTPAAGFVGTASFAYRPTDGSLVGQRVTVRILVTPATTGRTTLYAVGAGAGGGPRVRVFDAATDELRFDFFVYEPTFDGGVRVAVGDVTGDGVDDIVVGTGTGGGPRVVVFDGSTGDRIADFFAYEASFRGGVHVAVGDLDGDGVAEVIAGAGSTGAARVRSFAGKTFAPQLSFFAFASDAFGGVRVAAGDLDGDGRAEIVTAEGLSGKGVVAVFSGTGAETARFDAFPGYRGGLFVAALGGQVVVSRDSVIDYQGSVFDFLEPGLAPTDVSGGPEVRLFDYRAGLTGRPAPVETLSAYDPGYQGGVRISTAADPAGRFQLMTAPGEFGGSAVKFFARRGGALQSVGQLTAYEPTFLGGVFVGGSAGPFDLDV